MKVETKFNVDDIVYFMHDNRVATGNVATIQVYTHKPLGNEIVISVKYYLKGCSVKSDGYMEEIKRKSGKHYACLYDPNDVSEHCECVVDKVKGIRVVGTVLKKNLFMFNPRDYSWGREVNNSDIYITETLNGARASIDVNGCNTSIFNFQVKYLHELQHLCTMCNIKIDWKA